MRKHFLILMLLSLLPLVGWAAPITVTGISVKASTEYNAEDQALVIGSVIYPSDYSATNAGAGIVFACVPKGIAPTPSDYTYDGVFPEKKDVAVYDVWYYVKADGAAYTVDGDPVQLGSTAISKASLTVTAPPATSLEYVNSSDLQTLAAEHTADGLEGSYTLFYSIDGGSTWHNKITATEVQKLYLYWYAEPYNTTNYNYYGTAADPKGPVKLEITKGVNSFTTGVTVANVTYGEVPAPTGAVAKWSTGSFPVKYEYSNDGGTTWEITPADFTAGPWQVRAFVEDGAANFTGAKSEAVGFTVEKAEFVLTQTPVANTGLVFNNTDQKLLAKGVTAGAPFTIEWTIEGDDVHKWTSFAGVVAKNAGTYKVKYAVTPTNTNYELKTPPAPVEVTIGQKELFIGAKTLDNKKITDVVDLNTNTPLIGMADFLESADFYTETAEEQAIILTQLVQPTKTFAEIIAGAKVGSNTIDLKTNIVPSLNYKPRLLSPNATLVIVADEVTVVAPAGKSGLIYDGNDLPLIETAGSTNYGKVLYKVNDGAYTENASEIVGKKAGTYTITYKVEIDNTQIPDKFYEYTAGEKTFDVKIGQATPTISGLDIADWEYGETASVPSASTDFGTIAYTYAVKGSTEYSETVPTDANDYTVKATVAGTGDWILAEATKDFKITKAPLAITVADAGKTYGEAEPASFAYTAETFKGSDNAETIGLVVSRVAGENKGEYAITASYDATKAKNYEVTTTAGKFTIGKYALTLTAADATKVYGDADPSAFELTEAPAYQNGDDATAIALSITREAGENVGKYAINVTATSDNYEFTFVPGEFSITEAAMTVTAPKGLKLTYNGADQALVEAGTATGGDILYSVNGGAFEKTLPAAKNAGIYTVAYKYEADKNHTAPEGGILAEIEIRKATIGYMLSNLEKTWDGETFPAEQVEKVFTLYAGELMGDDVYDVPFTLSMPEDYKDAGTYTFKQAKVTFKDGKPVNYKVNFSGEAQIVINKKAIEAADYKAPTATVLTYNRTAQDLVEGAEVKTKYNELPIGKFVYATAEEGPYNETIPQGTDAVAYTVWYKVAGDKNHLDTEAASVTNTIAQKVWNPAVTFDSETFTFAPGVNRMPADLTVVDVISEEEKIALTETTEYTLAITKGEEPATELINVGTYTFTFTPAGNYTGDALVKTITINPATFEVPDFAEVSYNGEDQKPVIAVAGLVEGKDFEVEAADKMINAGEYHITFNGIDNYVGAKVEKIFKINKINAIAQASDATKVYNAVAGIEENPEITWGGLIKGEIAKDVITLEEGAITVKDPSANVGEYEIVINTEKFTSTNYNVLPGDKAAKFTITPAPLMVNWDTEATVGKVYGEADAAIEPKLDVTGAQGADEAAIIAGTVITRAAGEPAGKYAISLAADPDAEVFNNYTAEFTGADEAFVISKAPLTVSLAPQTVTYSGEVAVVEGFTASDLVVSGLKFDDDKDVITTLPAIAVPDDAINVGEYQITLSGAAADNYELSYLPATLTIDPFDISGATVEIAEQFAEIGKPADEAIDGTLFTITGLAKDADAAGFKVVAAPSFIDGDGNIIEGTDYTKGLVLDAADYDIALNYTGWENNFFGTLFVLGGSMLVLDDNAPIVTEAGKFNVTFTNRKVNQDTWNVLVLPFDVTIAQISDAFGYAAVDRLKTEAADGGIHFQVVSSGTIPAGEPFIVKPTSDNGKTNFNQITFYNVDVKAIDASAPGFENPYIEDAAGNKFIGTFVTANFWGQKYWYMSGGDWKDARNFTSAKPVTLKPLRAYIEFDEANVKAPFIYIEEPNGEVTAIDAASFNNGVQDANGWYTVNGMKLDNAPVEKGVYIKNGKKVVIK